MTWYDYVFLTFLTATGCITYVAKEWLLSRDWLFTQDRERDAPGSTGDVVDTAHSLTFAKSFAALKMEAAA